MNRHSAASASSAKIARSWAFAFECTLARPARPSSLPQFPCPLSSSEAIKTEIILCKMFCVLLLPAPSCPLLPDLHWESWLGPAPTMSAIVGAESRRRHSSSPLAAAFAFVRIRFATFRRSFQFSFCLNKKILNLIFLRVSCSLTISESLSRMRVADFALLFSSFFSPHFVVIILGPCVCLCVCVWGNPVLAPAPKTILPPVPDLQLVFASS